MGVTCFDSLPRPAVIGMVHVPALPGTPASVVPMTDIVAHCAGEARVYTDHGVDALILENMHDVPYLRGGVGPEVTAAMTAVAVRVSEVFSGPVGVQVLAAANTEALAIAHAAGLQFVRVEGFVYGHVADEGWIEACAGPLLRYRRQIGADSIAVVADIKKKHASHAVTADVSLAETARTAAFCGADAVVVTGTATGEATRPEDVTEAVSASGLPVLVGSGVTAENAERYRDAAALVVGSHFKAGGQWDAPLVPERVQAFMRRIGR